MVDLITINKNEKKTASTAEFEGNFTTQKNI